MEVMVGVNSWDMATTPTMVYTSPWISRAAPMGLPSMPSMETALASTMATLRKFS